MSNFNVTTLNTASSGSAISLGGEWTSRDQTQSNKYKSTIFQHMRQRERGIQKKSTNCDNGRPKSTPQSKLLQLSSDDVLLSCTPPPKSAPPGSKPRCERYYEVERMAGRKILEPHLKMKRSPRSQQATTNSGEVFREYPLGAGVTLTKSKNRVGVKIDTGLSMDPPPAPRMDPIEMLPADDSHES